MEHDKLHLGNRQNIYSSAIDANGYLHHKFGAHGGQLNKTQFPSFSFPLEWKPIPHAKSYALILEDFDACEVVGFPFVHWVACNIKGTKLVENESYLAFLKWDQKRSYPDNVLWQGHNSSVHDTLAANNKDASTPHLKGILPNGFTSNELNNSLMYFGPYPPNKDHLYTLTVFGLECSADQLSYILSFEHHTVAKLNRPYYVGDLVQAMDNKVVGSHTLFFKYQKAQ